jgi:hypothetical protein
LYDLSKYQQTSTDPTKPPVNEQFQCMNKDGNPTGACSGIKDKESCSKQDTHCFWGIAGTQPPVDPTKPPVNEQFQCMNKDGNPTGICPSHKDKDSCYKYEQYCYWAVAGTQPPVDPTKPPVTEQF